MERVLSGNLTIGGQDIVWSIDRETETDRIFITTSFVQGSKKATFEFEKKEGEENVWLLNRKKTPSMIDVFFSRGANGQFEFGVGDNPATSAAKLTQVDGRLVLSMGGGATLPISNLNIDALKDTPFAARAQELSRSFLARIGMEQSASL